jgi:peptidoglycan/LPS O-acetylase OafA/YrhL
VKETLEFFRQQFIEAKDVAKMQWRSFTFAVVLIVMVYIASLYIQPGWATYFISFPASLIVAITALARVNDIGPERMGKRWQVRKISLILAGAGSVMMMATPFSDSPMFPTWRAVIVMWGFAGAWLTTPDHPPWDYYISGKYRFLSHPPDKPARPRSPLMRVVGRVTKEHDVAALLKAQAEYEAREKLMKSGRYPDRRRGDGDGP